MQKDHCKPFYEKKIVMIIRTYENIFIEENHLRIGKILMISICYEIPDMTIRLRFE